MEANMDHFVQITFVLLILSMITEKTANWIKLRLPDNWVKRTVVQDIKWFAKKDEVEDEKDRKTREIQALTFMIGLTVAYACRANFFLLYNEDFVLSWWEVDWDLYLMEDKFALNVLSDFFGCGLTGIFLSLGSSFFHDLLGLLMETKNLKRKLKDRGSIENLHTIEEFDTYIAEVEPQVIGKEILNYARNLHGFDHYEYSEIDHAADIFLTDDVDQPLKASLSVDLANKTTRNIELNYIWI